MSGVGGFFFSFLSVCVMDVKEETEEFLFYTSLPQSPLL